MIVSRHTVVFRCSPLQYPLIKVAYEVTKALMIIRRDIRFRKGGQLVHKQICAKMFLATVATCSSSRICESRKIP